MVNWYDVGAYCAFFGFAFSLPLALVIMSYFLLPGRNSRFYVGLYFEIVATALGITYFVAFYRLSYTPSHIAWAILIMILVLFFTSIADAILQFHRYIHSFHLLLAHACLWVGCIATVLWYRDFNIDFGYASWEAFSFIAIWCGAMIALPLPPLVDFLLFYRGYLVPDDKLVSVTKGKSTETPMGTEVAPTRTQEVAQNRAETSPLRGTRGTLGDQVARD